MARRRKRFAFKQIVATVCLTKEASKAADLALATLIAKASLAKGAKCLSYPENDSVENAGNRNSTKYQVAAIG